MYWEDDSDTSGAVDDRVVDLAFAFHCRQLPLDSAYALYEALRARLPWLEDEPLAGVHAIHSGASGNGWMSPEDAGTGVILPSRRSRLVLRLPRERVEDARALTGAVFEISGEPFEVAEAQVRPLVQHTAVYARHVAGEAGEDEQAFLERIVALLAGALGIRCKKMVCGKLHRVGAGDREIVTRSLLLADLAVEDSVRLQVEGLGEGRKIGCGLFVGHREVRNLYARVGN